MLDQAVFKLDKEGHQIVIQDILENPQQILIKVIQVPIEKDIINRISIQKGWLTLRQDKIESSLHYLDKYLYLSPLME